MKLGGVECHRWPGGPDAEKRPETQPGPARIFNDGLRVRVFLPRSMRTRALTVCAIANGR